MSLLIVGSTGTLGRQIVRQALNDGFNVKCLVRNFRRASFLKEWGAELIYGDLKLPETLPFALYGVTAIIDCSTTRSTDDVYSTEVIDLKAKYILIESAAKAKIKHFIFFSILNLSNYRDLSIIRLKMLVESRLRNVRTNYTVFYLPGFFQGLVPQYAVPILDQSSVWITSEFAPIPYINTQDIALVVIKSLAVEQFNNKSLPLVGKKAWSSVEIIKLCEKLSGKRAKTTQVPIYILQFIMYMTKFFQWTWNISERLAFTEVLYKSYDSEISINELLHTLKISQDAFESLENYLQEYFQRIMKKLKELNYQVSINQSVDQNNF